MVTLAFYAREFKKINSSLIYQKFRGSILLQTHTTTESTEMTDSCGVFNVVNPTTNRVVGKVAQSFERVKTRHPYRKWLVINMNALNIMKTCVRVDDFRVWVALLARAEPENYVRFTNLELAAELDMYPSQVSAALKRLRENNILTSGRSSAGRVHKLSEGLQWRGDTKKFPKAVRPIGSSDRYRNGTKAEREAQHA